MNPRFRMNNWLAIVFALSLLLLLAALIAIVPSICSPTRAQSTTLYVAPGGDCGGVVPCYGTIQAAVDAASGGDIVKVAQGVYTGTGFQVVHISKAITVSGGFTRTNWSNPNPDGQPSVIDAEDVPRRRGIFIETGDDPGVSVSLDALIVQRGHTGTMADGGGIYVSTGTVTIHSCTIRDNFATGSSTGGGGGFFLENLATQLLAAA